MYVFHNIRSGRHPPVPPHTHPEIEPPTCASGLESSAARRSLFSLTDHSPSSFRHSRGKWNLSATRTIRAPVTRSSDSSMQRITNPQSVSRWCMARAMRGPVTARLFRPLPPSNSNSSNTRRRSKSCRSRMSYDTRKSKLDRISADSNSSTKARGVGWRVGRCMDRRQGRGHVIGNHGSGRVYGNDGGFADLPIAGPQRRSAGEDLLAQLQFAAPTACPRSSQPSLASPPRSGTLQFHTWHSTANPYVAHRWHRSNYLRTASPIRPRYLCTRCAVPACCPARARNGDKRAGRRCLRAADACPPDLGIGEGAAGAWVWVLLPRGSKRVTTKCNNHRSAASAARGFVRERGCGLGAGPPGTGACHVWLEPRKPVGAALGRFRLASARGCQG